MGASEERPSRESGVSINSQNDVSIGGDVVGGDKVTNVQAIAENTATAQLIVSLIAQWIVYLVLGVIPILGYVLVGFFVCCSPATFGIHALYHLIRGLQKKNQRIVGLSVAALLSSVLAPMLCVQLNLIGNRVFVVPFLMRFLTPTPTP